LLLFHFKDGTEPGALGSEREILLHVSLRKTDHHHQQLSNTFPRVGADRDNGKVRPEIRDPVKAFPGKSKFGEFPDNLIEFGLHPFFSTVVLAGKTREDPLVLMHPPSMQAIDLRGSNHTRRLAGAEDLVRLYRLWLEPLV